MRRKRVRPHPYDEGGSACAGRGCVTIESGMLNIAAAGAGYADGIYADGAVTIVPESHGMHSEYGDINIIESARMLTRLFGCSFKKNRFRKKPVLTFLVREKLGNRIFRGPRRLRAV